MNKAMLLRNKVAKLVNLIAGKKIRVTQRGDQAYVKYKPNGSPDLVNLPYIPDGASDGFIAAIEGFLDHEVAHILFTDFKAVKSAKEANVAALHNIIEDAYIEKRMMAAFPGSALNLRNVGEWFLREYTDKILGTTSDAFGVLIVPAIRAWSGQQIYQEYMRGKWELLGEAGNNIREYAEVALPKIKSSLDALNAAIRIKELLGESGGPEGMMGSSEGRIGTERGERVKVSPGPDVADMGVASVAEVHMGALKEMARLYAPENHNQKSLGREDAHVRLIQSMIKRYGPHKCDENKKVTVIFLDRTAYEKRDDYK